MLSVNFLKAIFRRTYVLKANGCRIETARRGRSSVCKMLQTFEDRVFQQTAEKCSITSIDCENKFINIKENPKIKDNYRNQQHVCNSNAEYEVSQTIHIMKKKAEHMVSNVIKLRDILHVWFMFVSLLKGSGENIE